MGRAIDPPMLLLTEFLLRISFGLAAGMAIVSARQVTSGYFRNHLYVTLGLSALAALLSRTIESQAFLPAVGAAVLSYIGSVMWLYEKPRAGKVILLLVALVALIGAMDANAAVGQAGHHGWQRSAAVVISGAVLGLITASMLLGHWYLNAPGMKLAPLRRLLQAASIAVACQAVFSGIGVAHELAAHTVPLQWWLFLILRWSFGIIGVLILLWMAWLTLKIPNTQSATGILYVAVIGAFVGETMSLLLSAESAYPL